MPTSQEELSNSKSEILRLLKQTGKFDNSLIASGNTTDKLNQNDPFSLATNLYDFFNYREFTITYLSGRKKDDYLVEINDNTQDKNIQTNVNLKNISIKENRNTITIANLPIKEANKIPPYSIEEKINVSGKNMNLSTVIIHNGSTLASGHYYAYHFNKNNRKWYLHNDENVTEVPNSEIELMKKSPCRKNRDRDCWPRDARMLSYSVP